MTETLETPANQNPRDIILSFFSGNDSFYTTDEIMIATGLDLASCSIAVLGLLEKR